MAATFSKLKDGSWGVRVTGVNGVVPGTTVTVSRKDGTTSTETVGKVLWSGGGVFLCTIAAKGRVAATVGDRSRGRSSKWTGCSCGSIDGEPRSSDCFTCQHDS